MNPPAQRPEPPYARIAAELRRRIDTGELRPGDRVPATRQISTEWGVAIATATKVLATLRREGLVRAIPGVGTVVATPAEQPAPRSRRREPGAEDSEVTLARIVRVSIEVADADGLTGVSMRRVATELGIATMSVYRYVAGRDELVGQMADTVLGEHLPAAPPKPGNWRAALETQARMHWAMYRAHPWMAQTISFTRPRLTASGLAHTDWVLRALQGLGLGPNEMLHASLTIPNYVRGTAINVEPELEARQETGITDDEWMRAQDPTFATIARSGAFPAFFGLLAEPELDLDLDSLFEFGLRQLLDGLAVRIESARE